MIFPKTPCTIVSAQITGFDAYGHPLPGAAPHSEKCSVVKLLSASKKTSIRTDKSASQGNADDIIADARLLFMPSVQMAPGDIIEIRGVKLVVDEISQQFESITEKLDHLMVDCSIWQ